MPEEMDIAELKGMDLDELKSFVNGGGQTKDSEEPEETTNQDDDQDDNSSDTDQQGEEIESVEDEDEEDEHQESDPETGQTEDEIPDFYKGKSPKDLINIIEENKKFTSRQGNEIHNLRQQLNSFQSNVEKKLETFTPTNNAEKKQFLDELAEETGYNKDEMTVIQKIVKHQATEILRQSLEEKEQKQKQQKAEIGVENQNTWDLVKDLYPNSTEIESAMVEEIKRSSDQTIYKPGWVKTFLKNYKKQPTNPQGTGYDHKAAVKKRIVKTSTVKGSSPKSHLQTIKREDLQSKDPEKFRRAWNHFNPSAKLERI